MKALLAEPEGRPDHRPRGPPYHALFIRGTASTSIVEGMPEQYVAAARRYMGREAGDEWVAGINQMSPHAGRIAIRPEWVAILDFERRFPSAIEEKILAAAGAAPG